MRCMPCSVLNLNYVGVFILWSAKDDGRFSDSYILNSTSCLGNFVRLKPILVLSSMTYFVLHFKTIRRLTLRSVIGKRDSACIKIKVSFEWISYTGRVASAWWRHQMETFSALLALREENSLVTVKFLSQRAVTRSFDVSLICASING